MKILDWISFGRSSRTTARAVLEKSAEPTKDTTSSAGDTNAIPDSLRTSLLALERTTHIPRPSYASVLEPTSQISQDDLDRLLESILGIQTYGLWRDFTSIENLSTSFASYCRNKIGYLDSYGYRKERPPRKYTYFEELDADEKIKAITYQLLRRNYNIYRRLFEERKLPYAARDLYRQILYTIIKRQKGDRLRNSIVYLLSGSQSVEQQRAAASRDRNTKAYERARGILKSNGANELLYYMGNNQVNFCQNQGHADVEKIWERINKWSSEGFSDAFRALEDLSECQEVGAVDNQELSYKPNFLSCELDKIEDTVKNKIVKEMTTQKQDENEIATTIMRSVDSELDELASKEPIENICKAVEEVVYSVCQRALQKERETVAVLEAVQKRTNYIKAGVVGAVLLVGGGLAVTTGVAVHNSRARRAAETINKELEEAHSKLKLGIDQLKKDIYSVTKINFQEIYDKEKEELAGKEEKVKFGYLAYYLERLPSDEELRKELEYFLKHHKEIPVDPEIAILFEKYLSGEINKEKLADGLLSIDLTRHGRLPYLLSSLKTVRAIQTNKFIKYIPGDLKGVIINDLRDMFDLKEWDFCYHLEGQEIMGKKVPDGQIIPTIGQLVSAGIIIGTSEPFLFDFIGGKKKEKELEQKIIEAKEKGEELSEEKIKEERKKIYTMFPAYIVFKNDAVYVARAAHNIVLLRQRVNERGVEETDKYENPDRNPNLKKLLEERDQLDSIDSLETLAIVEDRTRPIIDGLRQERTRLDPVLRGLARCLVISSEYEAMIKEQDEELKERYRARKN